MAQKSLDLKGLKCPLPALKTKKAMAGLKAGDVLRVEATDPLSVIDIPAYCNESGNRLVAKSANDGVNVFEIEKVG